MENVIITAYKWLQNWDNSFVKIKSVTTNRRTQTKRDLFSNYDCFYFIYSLQIGLRNIHSLQLVIATTDYTKQLQEIAQWRSRMLSTMHIFKSSRQKQKIKKPYVQKRFIHTSRLHDSLPAIKIWWTIGQNSRLEVFINIIIMSFGTRVPRKLKTEKKCRNDNSARLFIFVYFCL